MLPHVVKEQDLSKVGSRAKPAGEQITGDPEAGFKEAEVVSEGTYGIPVITHCCLEPHGAVIGWQGDKVDYWPSTQGVSTIGNELARALEVPADNVHVAHGLHGRRIRQQVPGRSVADRERASVQGKRRQAGKGFPRSRH